MQIKLNLNDIVKFKLTEEGQKILINYYTNDMTTYKQSEKFILNKIDNEGYIKMQFHEICNIFGKYLINGNSKKLIKNNNIIIET